MVNAHIPVPIHDLGLVIVAHLPRRCLSHGLDHDPGQMTVITMIALGPILVLEPDPDHHLRAMETIELILNFPLIHNDVSYVRSVFFYSFSV